MTEKEWNELKKEIREKKIKRQMRKMELIAATFYHSAKQAVLREDTLIAGAVVGLSQGLKYNGSIKRGMIAGAATVGVFAAITGLVNVNDNMKRINEASSREDE